MGLRRERDAASSRASVGFYRIAAELWNAKFGRKCPPCHSGSRRTAVRTCRVRFVAHHTKPFEVQQKNPNNSMSKLYEECAGQLFLRVQYSSQTAAIVPAICATNQAQGHSLQGFSRGMLLDLDLGLVDCFSEFGSRHRNAKATQGVGKQAKPETWVVIAVTGKAGYDDDDD